MKEFLSTSKLSLLATSIHIFLLVLLIKYDEVLHKNDWEEATMLFIVMFVILALLLAISSRKTKLGVTLMILNGIYLLFCFFMGYFIANYTFKV
ncbi:MAG: hypothetical protein ACN6OB_22100 [Chryseobacterium jejuense]|uniref:hypothetical protein n=1 Tax=Chryseobacterium jejuense TaxID=445960 RepID=UPI003D14D593